MADETDESRNLPLKLYHGLLYLEHLPITLSQKLYDWVCEGRVLPTAFRYVLGIAGAILVVVPLLMLGILFGCFAEIMATTPPFRKLAGGWWFFAYFPGHSLPCWKEGTHILNDWIREEASKDPECSRGRRVGLVEFEDPKGEWVQRDIQVSWTLNS